ncbi:FxsB family cyclophane-forming radical SAM/SPASM peptide maturase [Nonomuraea cypriaca]|uniref:FxsB family cyclophane-forming radical SAM/SPASM peptide maturase n=1 Tax=Nonomuraea cypriaca TaxID=1187855 RepID=UPI002E2BB0F1|nr:FxsB family cyclophane-forming radical SAM/SPASM peptide maturase [Nonomuraea cypriaca]
MITPFQQFVLKVHSRCDLSCDHCYVYEHADQSWRSRPRGISLQIVDQVAARIAEHVKQHDVRDIHVVLHGGEPLLAGHERLAGIADALRGALDGICRLHLHIQTNGVRLDDRFCDLFAEREISVGISLDGDRAANDRHRRYASGKSSYDQVIRAVERLRARPEIYGGLLCTIDVANDPIAVYEALLELGPPRIDFLLPYATWDTPPARPSPTAYADWLIAIFDRWDADGRPMPIRLFESIARTVKGGASLSESIGLEPSSMVVIDTDGSYELVDSLKVTYDGAPATGYDVFLHTLDDVAVHPKTREQQRGLEGLSDTCRRCPVVRSCGGGLYTHRYRDGSFDNPSVYCEDLFKLVTHLGNATKMSTHAIPYASLDALATGFGDAADIELLADAQRSLRRALIAALRPLAPAGVWELLTDLDTHHRDVLESVLAHPYVRSWAVDCLQGERQAGPGGRTEPRSSERQAGLDAGHAGQGPVRRGMGHVERGADLAGRGVEQAGLGVERGRYLANVVAAAAVRAGRDLTLPVVVVDGAAYLPTVGTLRGLDGDSVTLVVRAGRIVADAGAEWQPVRTLASGDYSVVLEDSDPHRDSHQWPAAGRLDEAVVAAWQASFEQAWRLIEKEYPQYAPGLRGGLSTLTPLAQAPPGQDVSSTARHAFGAVAAALPDGPATLALLIMHEFQHVKLGAVFDLFDLYDRADTRLYHAPWRQDPRPLEGLLQGTYAHIAVTDFWRTRRHTVEGAELEKAQEEYLRWRGHTLAATETLVGSKALTALGERFVGRMRETLASWPVDARR